MVPATVLAKPNPAKYVIVSKTKGCHVTLNGVTRTLAFQAEKGHYGQFTVGVRHENTTRAYHFIVRKPKPGQELPTTPLVVHLNTTRTVWVIVDVLIPTNFAPVLQVNGGVISWSTDKGAQSFKGAISTAPRFAAGRQTTYVALGPVTSWTPATPPCGTTLYYGVASEGNAGEQWTANEVSITGPPCQKIYNVAPALTYGIDPAGDHEPALIWAQDPGATSYKAAICTDARGTSDRSCTYIDNIGSPGDPFGAGEPAGQVYWDLLGNSTADPVAAPCGTHWFSIASEGPAGELWASAEYEFGPGYFGEGLPACPPPEATGPPVGEQVFSTNPEVECADAINLINQDDGSSPTSGGIGELNVLSPTAECQTMQDLVAPSNDGVLGPVSTVNQDHLCEDWATVINEATKFIQGWYVGSTGDCDVVTSAGYIEAFNGSMASGNGLDAVPDYAQAAHNLYQYTLPWTAAVAN